MNRNWIILAALGLGIGTGYVAEAHGGGPVIIVIPGGSHGGARQWTTVKHLPYATWDAQSTVAAGTEVAGDVIDSAPLTPHGLFASDQDLVNSVRVWLPKGGLLVKMGGDTGDWYCSWRFDFRSDVTQQQVEHGRLDGYEYNLCVQAGPDGHTTKARIMISFLRDLMTISQDDSGATRYRDDIQDYNSINIKPVSPDLFPKLVNMQITSHWKDRNFSAVCLNNTLTSIRTGELFHSEGPCFAGVGQSVQFSGGTYTLVSIDAERHYKIRIDMPMSVRGLAPQGAY